MQKSTMYRSLVIVLENKGLFDLPFLLFASTIPLRRRSRWQHGDLRVEFELCLMQVMQVGESGESGLTKTDVVAI